jgi:two-component system chemotaxis response regulator CheB
VLVAQHLAEGFTAGLARWLRDVSVLEVEVVSGALAAQPGRVYLPADGHHLEVSKQGMVQALRADDPFPPSGDRLLASLARAYGARAAGVVLTGMGEDGARGLLALRNTGGVTMVQDPSMCTVGGMPAAAIALGAARRILPIDAIADSIRTLAGA